jgi:F-type H+-transporting ATPase subunit b
MILANSLTTPAIGTIFWTTLIFSIFFIVLKKFAWKPILMAVKAREESIRSSLESAEKAREDMLVLQSDNAAILKKAREEREEILKEARDARDLIINEAKNKASEEAAQLVEKARTGIEMEKQKALTEIREQVAVLSVDIASKILGEKLKENEEQSKMISRFVKDIDFKKN